MSLLREEDRQFLIEEFRSLREPVQLVVFSQEFECQYCRDTRLIAEELSQLSGSIELQVYDFVKDAKVAEQYQVDKVPAMAVVRGGEHPKDYGIRFFGIPAGYEFTSLVEDIRMVSEGESGLSAASKSQLATLTEPLHLQVFVTPT
jgi:glutaredoxin-like protein